MLRILFLAVFALFAVIAGLILSFHEQFALMVVVALFVLSGGLAILFLLMAVWAGNWECREAMRQVAESLGLEFSEQAPQGIIDELKNQKLFRRGAGRWMKCMIQGELDGIRVIAGKFFWRKNRKAMAWWVTACILPNTEDLPLFRLSPEGTAKKFSLIAQARDIDFSESEVQHRFSRQYDLIGHDEDSVRRAFANGAVEFFSARPGWTVYCDGQMLVVWREKFFWDHLVVLFRNATEGPKPKLQAEAYELVQMSAQVGLAFRLQRLAPK